MLHIERIGQLDFYLVKFVVFNALEVVAGYLTDVTGTQF